jgi:hypothetical protein
MERIGAKHYEDRPARPKFMRRSTYERICDQIADATLRMFKAVLGRAEFETCQKAAWKETAALFQPSRLMAGPKRR